MRDLRRTTCDARPVDRALVCGVEESRTHCSRQKKDSRRRREASSGAGLPIMRTLSRPVALLILVAFAACLSGVPEALAANGSVRGRISVQGGALPPGTEVHATPAGGKTFLTGTIEPGGTFAMRAVPEGSYLFEVVGPDGTVFGAVKTRVPPSDLQLNMIAWVKPAAVAPAPAAAPTPAAGPAPVPGAQAPPEAARKEPAPKQAPAPRPAKVPSRSSAASSKKKWAVVLAVVGGLGAG